MFLRHVDKDLGKALERYHTYLRNVLQFGFFFSNSVLRPKLRASHMVGKCCATELCPGLCVVCLRSFHLSRDQSPPRWHSVSPRPSPPALHTSECVHTVSFTAWLCQPQSCPPCSDLSFSAKAQLCLLHIRGYNLWNLRAPRTRLK